jgi:tripartite-type tricarboxylate transporter receptor subunit TctC
MMNWAESMHEPEAQLLSGQDAIRDAERLQALLRRNRKRAEREVQLRVPFTVIIEALDQLEAGELRLLAQRLEERLAVVQH